MATPAKARELLSDEEKQVLLDTMENEELKQGVLDGTYYIAGPSDIPGKPMVRWVSGPSKGKPVKGSGAVRGAAKRMAETSKANAWKRTGAYRELLDHHWKPKLEWMFEQAENMIKGGAVFVDAVCPECSHEFKVEAYKKGDAQALKVVWESLIGRATERKEVDVNIRALMAQLDERVAITDIEVIDVTPEQVSERMALAQVNKVKGEYADGS